MNIEFFIRLARENNYRSAWFGEYEHEMFHRRMDKFPPLSRFGKTEFARATSTSVNRQVRR